jgi:hypothetical protein
LNPHARWQTSNRDKAKLRTCFQASRQNAALAVSVECSLRLKLAAHADEGLFLAHCSVICWVDFFFLVEFVFETQVFRLD